MKPFEKIRYVRLFREISQNNLAKSIKMSQQFYSKIELGEYKLTPSLISRIAAKLQIEPKSLESAGDEIKFLKPEKLYEKIKLERRLRNVCQKEIADKLQITQSAYARIESGGTRIGLELFLKIADILKLNRVELLDEFYPIEPKNDTPVVKKLDDAIRKTMDPWGPPHLLDKLQNLNSCYILSNP